VQLEGQLAALEAGAGQLAGMRSDLDEVNAFLRCWGVVGACGWGCGLPALFICDCALEPCDTTSRLGPRPTPRPQPTPWNLPPPPARRERKKQLIERHPELRARLMRREEGSDDG
jgi:hypothetical protein